MAWTSSTWPWDVVVVEFDTVGMSIYTVSTIGAINAIDTVGCLGRTTHTSVFDTDHFVTVYGGGR